jgi:hypothetical protein
MRKILLGTTAVVSAVVGAAVMAPQASAQEAPTVRIGGFFRAYYGYTQQSSNQNNLGSGLPTNVAGLENVGPNTSATGAPGGNVARLGKHDISTDTEVHVFVNGKLANGITYGAVIEINFNQQEGRNIGPTRASTGKTTAGLDEAYAFIAHPRVGQVRFGDEDGVMGGLMNSGWITGFGTGGVHGEWESFVTRQAGGRTTTAPGGLGDNSKIIYMTPQFFGFDFGASYAPNAATGEDTGCPNNSASGFCDRAYAFSGARNFGIYAAGPEQAARRNEYQLAARWRGNLAGVGLAATVGYIGAGAARDLTSVGLQQVRVFNNMNIWQVGAQASYLGLTVGAAYMQGDFNFFWGNTLRGDRPAEQFTVGAQYSAGPFTIGANYVTGLFEGGSRFPFAENAAGTALTQARNIGNSASMRRWGLGVGANYRLAPGLDLIAEYVHYSVREQGRDLDAGRQGIQSRAFSDVFILGTRLAF